MKSATVTIENPVIWDNKGNSLGWGLTWQTLVRAANSPYTEKNPAGVLPVIQSLITGTPYHAGRGGDHIWISHKDNNQRVAIIKF